MSGLRTFLFLLVTVAIAPSNAFAQGDVFGQNLYLFSLPPHTDYPEISFTNDGLQTSIQQRDGTMLFKSPSDKTAFLISRHAPSSALNIVSDGVTVGPNLINVSRAFEIYASDSTDVPEANIYVRNDHIFTEPKLRTMMELINHGPVRFEFGNTDTNQSWAFQTNHADGFLINRLGSGGNEFSIRKSGMITMGPGGKLNFVLDPAGNLQIDGTLTQSSDKNKKEAFEDVSSQEILESIARLPITSWRYKDDETGIRHIGPVSQDFHREFQLGKDDKTIASVDADGVALVAIQALLQRVNEQQARIDQLEEKIAGILSQQ